MRTATSLISSAVVPPAPQASTGPKLVVVDHAHDQLDSGRRHRLHDETLERVARRGDRGLDLAGAGAHRVSAVETEPHPAGVALVQQARGHRLERDRVAQRRAAATAASASGTTRVLTSGSP